MVNLIAILIVVALIIFFVFTLKKNPEDSLQKLRQILHLEYGKPGRLICSVLQLLSKGDPLRYLVLMSKLYENFEIDGSLFVSNPKIVEHVLSSNNFRKCLPDQTGLKTLGNSFITDTTHRPPSRDCISKVFSKDNIQKFRPIFESETHTLISRWKNEGDGIKNVWGDLLKLSLDIVSQCLFNKSFKTLHGENKELYDALVCVLDDTLSKGVVSVESSKFESSLSIINEHSLMIANDVKLDTKCSLHPLSSFEEQLADNIKLFIMAGSETTASTLCIALQHLSRVKEKENYLYKALCTSREDGISKCNEFMNNCLQQYPTAPVVVREACKDKMLLNTSIFVKDGMRVVALLWCLGGTQSKSVPFSYGQRRCLGNHFAELQLQVILPLLISACTFTPSSSGDFKISIDWTHSVVHPHENQLVVNFR